ncbi:MAG: hypothetical protein SF339_24860 [Blastocatellia bacterium]|nr:hypothetical protein [Blastocatellia bacterium]
MMKKRLPVVATLLLIAAALAYFTRGQRPAESTAPLPIGDTPEAVIWHMADAARTGDTAAYLDCFSGELREKLRRTAVDLGEEPFRQYLQRLHDEVAGLAVSDLIRNGADEVSLLVEFAHRDRNESQRHHFRRENGAWKIVRIE